MIVIVAAVVILVITISIVVICSAALYINWSSCFSAHDLHHTHVMACYCQSVCTCLAFGTTRLSIKEKVVFNRYKL